MASLRTDLRHALDPAAWARDCLGFEPDAWQNHVLQSDSDRLLMLACRQSGKSTVAAILALHRAVFWPRSLVLLLSPSLRQSGELFRKVAGDYGAIAEAVPAAAESALRLELENGSRVVSLPGSEATTRGYSAVSLLVIDEAARVPDALFYAVRPALATSAGRIVALSTPWTRAGWFYSEWQDGIGWQRARVTAADVARIKPAFLAEERRIMPTQVFEREYECVFGDLEGAVFDTDAIRAAFTDRVRPLALPAFGG